MPNINLGRQTPGVYLLFLQDELVYIGSSNDMEARVLAHRTNGRPFDRAHFIPTKDYRQVERALIQALRPAQNRTVPNGHKEAADDTPAPIYINPWDEPVPDDYWHFKFDAKKAKEPMK